MAEHPIILSTEEVRAVLDGRKTLDVRPMRVQPEPDACEPFFPLVDMPGYWTNEPRMLPTGVDPATPGCWVEGDKDHRLRKAPSRVGDVLWVRETWQILKWWTEYGHHLCDVWAGPVTQESIGRDQMEYAADRNPHWDGPWRSSIHLPRWAARLFLLVTDVRVKRVQEITEAEALAAGFAPALGNSARAWFSRHWCDRYAKRGLGWQANPWVWLRAFERTDSLAGPGEVSNA